MDIYYLLVQNFLLTIQLFLALFLYSEGRHYRQYEDWSLSVDPPEILPGDRNLTFHSNERVVLKCTVRNRRTKDVQWRIVHQPYPLTIGMDTWTSDKDISVMYRKINETDEDWDLVIKRAQPRHTNTYECQISCTKCHSRYVFLKVLDKPIERNPAITLTGTAYVDIHHRVNLTCNASGDIRAPDDVDWFHNGNIIDPRDTKWQGRLRIYNRFPPGRRLISELIIENSTLDDQGIYVCRSSDTETKSFPVSILDTRSIDSSRYNNRDGVPNKTKRTDKMSGIAIEERSHKNKATRYNINYMLMYSVFLLAIS